MAALPVLKMALWIFANWAKIVAARKAIVAVALVVAAMRAAA